VKEGRNEIAARTKLQEKSTNEQRSGGIFRNRNFLDYLAIYLASSSATQVVNVSLIWVVYALTHSALDVAIVGVANTVSTVIVTLPAGVWIDRVERRLLLLVSNTISLSCLVILTLLDGIHDFEIPAVVAIVVVWAGALELQRSTSYSVLPDLVSAKELLSANGVAQSSFQIVNSISLALGGGLIVVVGVFLTFGYGVVGYGIAAIFAGFLVYRFRSGRVRIATSAQTANRNMKREIVEGLRWLITQRGLFSISILALISNFLFGMPFYFLVIYVTSSLKAGAFIYSALLALFAVGTGAGSLLAGRTPKALQYAGKVNILCWMTLGGASFAVLALFPITLVALVAATSMGVGLGFGNNIWLTAAQNLVPPEMRGRYFAIDGLLSFVGGPPSIAVGGILITMIGINHLFELSGVLLLISALGLSFIKSLRKLDGRSKAPAATTM
jgi:MFS family permease